MAKLTLDMTKAYDLEVGIWEGRIHCVYLNDYRIAGGKPWGGCELKKFTVTLKDLAEAVPDLRAALEAANKEGGER